MAGEGQNLGQGQEEVPPSPPPPPGFNREQERQVAIEAEPSLFCVLVNLRRHKKEEVLNKELEKKYNSVGKAVKNAERRKDPGEAPIIPFESAERLSTGFAVATNGNNLRILTCAHVISDTYTEGMHGQLTLEELNNLFSFRVHCVHQELELRTMNSDLKISDRTRHSVPAIVVALDTQLDLLVLEVEVGELCHHLDDEGFQIACEEDHPIIHFANEDPNDLQKLVLAGWPPQRSGAHVTGQVSHSYWTYDAITALNIKGYTMRLLEISGMAADSGFSGAPVLNNDGECVGVFHGVFNLIYGYAICFADVIKFLNAQNMFHWEPEP